MSENIQAALCDWRVVSASVSGTSHQSEEKPCQDAYQWKKLPEGILVAAVADGAGSAALGEVGSHIAAQTAVDTISAHKTIGEALSNDTEARSLLTTAIDAAAAAVAAEAAARQVNVRDLATTLILVVATSQVVAAAQVGDGAAVVSDDRGSISVLNAPPNGEYINETTFLISPDAVQTAQMNVWRGKIAHVALFSDGLQMLALKMPEATPHEPFFSPLFRFVEATTDEDSAQEKLEAFLRSPRVTEKTDDDLTLLLAALVSDR